MGDLEVPIMNGVNKLSQNFKSCEVTLPLSGTLPNTFDVNNFDNVGSPIYFNLEPKIMDTGNANSLKLVMINNGNFVKAETCCEGNRESNVIVDVSDKIITKNNSNYNFGGSYFENFDAGLPSYWNLWEAPLGNCDLSNADYFSVGSSLRLDNTGDYWGYGRLNISSLNLININKVSWYFRSIIGNNIDTGERCRMGLTSTPIFFQTGTSANDAPFTMYVGLKQTSGINFIGSIAINNTSVYPLMNGSWYKVEFETTDLGSKWTAKLYTASGVGTLVYTGAATGSSMIGGWAAVGAGAGGGTHYGAYIDNLLIETSGTNTSNNVTVYIQSGNSVYHTYDGKVCKLNTVYKNN